MSEQAMTPLDQLDAEIAALEHARRVETFGSIKLKIGYEIRILKDVARPLLEDLQQAAIDWQAKVDTLRGVVRDQRDQIDSLRTENARLRRYAGDVDTEPIAGVPYATTIDKDGNITGWVVPGDKKEGGE